MKQRLLNFIICPSCKVNFQLSVFSEEEGEVKEGLLTCPFCKEVYPIVNFIPRVIKGSMDEYPDFLEKYGLSSLKRNQAPFKEVSAVTNLSQKSKESFGYQWTRGKFSRIIPKFEDDFLNYVYPLQKNFFRNKIGLDLGCGFGRHIYYAVKLGAEMIGIDFSSAIDSAYRNTKELSNIHFIQADIYNLPLRKSCFDFAYSIGVLHHLPDPEAGFKAILPLVRKKGSISVWVYSKSRPVVNFTIESIRLITKKIPHKILYFICIILAAIEWVFVIMPYKISYKIPFIKGFLKKIILKRIRIYSEYPFNVLSADWFDRLSAPIRYYYNDKEVKDWFVKTNLNLKKISPTGGYGWRATGEKI